MILRFIGDDLAALDGLQQGIVQISGKPGPFLQSFVKTPLQRTGVPLQTVNVTEDCKKKQ